MKTSKTGMDHDLMRRQPDASMSQPAMKKNSRSARPNEKSPISPSCRPKIIVPEKREVCAHLKQFLET